tara:strand:+ start:158 stop:1534 length:1377 start_codon:yes stop_codon:yes gene_type:complete
MAIDGVRYAINTSFTNNDHLLAYYDFTSGTGVPLDFTDGVEAVVKNQNPASNTGVFSGIIINSISGSEALAKTFATGTFLNNNKARLSASNLKIPTSSLNYNSLTAIFDFEFDSSTPVTGGVLFGSLDKTSGSANGEVITGAKGYNFGVNDRGKLFYQGFDRGGDYICVASNIELSKRNIISFSLGANTVEISRVDYLNDNVTKQNFTIDTDYIANSDQFYLGGSNSFHSTTTGNTKTLSGYLNEFALISGYASSEIVKTIGSGMIGEYFFSQGASTPRVEVTGFSETIVYRTGITGYEFNTTGFLSISTGREMLTGSSISGSTGAVVEGDKYFKYYTLNNGSVKTFYKEEIGYLDPNSGYTYAPTGSGAFATLGLQDISDTIATHVETEGIDSAGTVTLRLYESVAQTGTLTEISGITQTPLTRTINEPAIPVSGVRLTGNAEDFKKNYIYYLGQRL